MLSFYMMSGKTHPFDAACHDDVESNIVNDNPSLSSVNDPAAVHLVHTMLTADPTKRPSAEVLLR